MNAAAAQVQMMKAVGMFSRKSGIANAQANEVAYLAWQRRQPKIECKQRLFVDTASDVYVDFMQKVPITADADLLRAEAVIKEEILGQIGVDGLSDEASGSEEVQDAPSEPARRYPKRNSGRALFREASNPDSTVQLGNSSTFALLFGKT